MCISSIIKLISSYKILSYLKKVDIAIDMFKQYRKLNFLLEVVIHFIFWLIVYYFYNYFLGYGSLNTTYVNNFSLFLMPVTISISYFFYFFLIPNYLLKKKQGLFFLYTIYTFIISFFFIVLSILYGLVFSEKFKLNDYTPITKGVIFIILGIYFIVFIVITITLLIHNYKSTLKSEDLKNKFLQTQLQLKEQELKFLKMQIHPHFLFNTLNTLYGFALKKSDDAPDMILKLSKLLDYILYQVDKPSVLLLDEIKHIENYIALEKMRFQESLEVNFTKELHVENIEVAPMLLLPFIENSFKHGVQINDILKVDVFLKTSSNQLDFTVKNTAKKHVQTKNGIGLDNIKKRLKMLFNTNYTLNILQEENTFNVELKIPLKNV